MKVIVISPHPDDETLGCGGSILKHVKNGDTVIWLIVTSVFTRHGFTAERVKSRQREIQQVNDELGFSKTYELGFPTTQLSEIGERKIIDAINNVFRIELPEIIYLPNRTDAHSDHKMVFDAAIACSKTFRNPSIKRILMYECLSETDFAAQLHEKIFIPNYFVDITDEFNKKLEIVQIYSSEIGEHPFPRSLKSIEALSILRGSQAGVCYAEAFQMIKFIDK
jgi:LmbE family N-acetylglucosaminyl deacetylase